MIRGQDVADQAMMPGDDFETLASGPPRGSEAFPDEQPASGPTDDTASRPLRGMPFALDGILVLGAGLLTAMTGAPFGSSRTTITIVLIVGVVSTLLFFASNQPDRG